MHIENNTLLIVPNTMKNNIIKKNKILVNYKIMSLDEFIKKYYFDYNEESIYFLINNYNIKYDIAKVYLKNIYYVEDKIYNIEKLDKLVEIKKELENNNLLIKDKLFKESLKDKKIVVYGYNYIEKPYKELLDSLNASYIEDTTTYNNQELYEFTTSEEEIDFIISKIVELIDKGTSLNNIKIIKSEYDDNLKDKLNLYGINIPIKINLYGTNIIKLFLDNLNNDLDNTLNIIKSNINLNNEINIDIYNKLISILNKYTFIDNKETIKDILINEFKNTNLNINFKEQIEFINLEDNIDNNYVFLPGFNIGMYPSIIKDEDYITDNIKEYVNLEKTIDINKKIKKYLINKIKCTNNLVLTYKTKEKREYYVSTLNEELNLIPIKNYKMPYYINIDNKIKLAKKLDILNKYNEITPDLDLLYSNYKDIDYNTYDNKYHKIDRNIDHIDLSYSSMNKYYECGFKYYIDHVLKLNIYEETFNTIIGNLFHYVLSKAFIENFNFEDTYNEYLTSLNKEFTNKEKVFLNNLKEELKLIINTINKQLKLISLDNTLYEEEIKVSNNSKVTFIGYVDKLMYKQQDDKTFVAIIDYKTGNTNLNLNNIIYGLDLQLPVYLYLTKNSKLKNVEISGFYLQKILNKEIKKDYKKSFLEQKENNLKLKGYSIDKNIELFDKTYKDSNLIEGLKIKNDGSFYSSSKVLNKEKIDKIINLVDNKINEATDNILNNNFDINPKYIKGENISCKYCKYKDICFMTNKDIIYLKEYKDLDFLK